MNRRPRTGLLRVAASCVLLLLSGCSAAGYWVLDPKGPVALSSFHSFLIDVGAMLAIIAPTTLLVAWCIWRYRGTPGRGTYSPLWSHSLPIEIASWGFPAAIVAFLGFYSLKGTFDVNPFGPAVLSHGRSADADRPPINVDVITTDWQWLFIYPDQHIAVANELVVPVHTPVRFRLTSSTVTNAIFIPQLVGQIDIMPGMRTRQSLLANHLGSYQGFTADFSGPGFSWMRFKTRVVTRADFDDWTAKVARSSDHMSEADFNKFAEPTINVAETVTYFSDPARGLFDRIVQEVDMGKLFTTPRSFTDKSSYRTGNGRQPTHAGAVTD